METELEGLWVQWPKVVIDIFEMRLSKLQLDVGEFVAEPITRGSNAE